ncbi:MAG: protein TolR [Alphaproteobacteria bacterium]
MGAKLSGSRARRGRNVSKDAFSEINVTPMVDVMLVLLVIFMVAAPMMTTGVTVDLPESSANPVKGQDEPLVVAINAKGKIYLGETEIKYEELTSKLAAITQEKKDTRIFIRGDKGLNYGEIMRVMGAINQAGYTKVALLTEVASTPGKRK